MATYSDVRPSVVLAGVLLGTTEGLNVFMEYRRGASDEQAMVE